MRRSATSDPFTVPATVMPAADYVGVELAALLEVTV